MLRAILIRLSLLSVLLIGLLTFLVASNPGLKLILNITNRLIPGTLTSQTIEGHLWKDLTLHTLTYTNKKQSISLDTLHLKWHLKSLFPLHVTLEALELGTLDVAEEKTKLTLDAFTLSGAWLHGMHLNGGTHITLPQGTLYANVETEDNHIKTTFTLGRNHLIIEGPVRGPWAINANLADLKQLNPAFEALHSHLILKGVIRDMTHATVEARLTQGYYQLPEGSAPEAIHFQGATLNATLSPKALNLKGRWNIDQNTAGTLALTLPGVRLNSIPLKTQPVTGQVHVTLASLRVLGERIELGETGVSLQKPQGAVHATLDVQGALNQPKIKGTITLTNGQVTIPELGLNLAPVELTAKTDAAHWSINAHIRPNNGTPLTLYGNGNITPTLTGSLVLQGSDVIVMATPEYFVEASPNLTLTKTPTLYSLEGSVLIPKARITPLSFNHTVRLTRDAVFTTRENNPNPLNLNLNLALDMGDDVGINIKGIQGFVDGMLHIKQRPKEAITANGELKLRDGRFEAYGQKLYIQQGELIFLGQQIDNPNLRVRAVRRFTQTNTQFSGSNELFDFSDTNLDDTNFGNKTTVGITVSGRLDAPRVKLYSSPNNLSEANILSMLLLGKPANQASKSGGQILLKAMTSMHLDSGSKGLKMLQDLQKSTGVDLDVQNSSMGTASSDLSKTSVMVGKSITKRIYLQYNVGLFQENSSVFTLTYILNKFLSMKVTASDIGNGIDVMYSRSD